MSEIRLWSETQGEAFDGLKSLWDQRRALNADAAAYAGGLQWKVVKDRVYLVRNRIDPASGVRRFESLGVKSPETERRHEAFVRGRDACQKRAVALDGRLRIQAAVAKASKIGRAPVAVGDFFRALSASPSYDRVVLTGSMSFFAYETLARASVPTDALALPGERPDLDLIVEDDADVNEVERLFRTVSVEVQRSPGAHRITSPLLTIDVYTRADVRTIAGHAYDEEQTERFLETIETAPIDGFLVDRSGQPAPVHVLPIDAFVALKLIRQGDAIRGEALSALDARQARLGTLIAENVTETSSPDDDDAKIFFGGP